MLSRRQRDGDATATTMNWPLIREQQLSVATWWIGYRDICSCQNVFNVFLFTNVSDFNGHISSRLWAIAMFHLCFENKIKTSYIL